MIGPNGAGKSTLLKMLARILTPDNGRIAIDGRVSALLELGAGFHPEYSAVENIFLSGAFYGMSRSQLKPRVDSIIEFAELARFADNPVKTYSSGMYARLGFAIAVSVEPDVLLCDEVLAVGDESFRQRCYDRMLEFRDAGRTVVLVTHDLGAVHQFCDRAIWLQRGAIQRDGDPREVVRAYLREVNAGDEAISELSSAARGGAAGTHTPLNSGVPIVLHSLRVTAADGAERSIFENGETVRIEVGYLARNPVRSPICEVEVHRHDGTHVATGSTFAAGYETGRRARGARALRLGARGSAADTRARTTSRRCCATTRACTCSTATSAGCACRCARAATSSARGASSCPAAGRSTATARAARRCRSSRPARARRSALPTASAPGCGRAARSRCLPGRPRQPARR